MAANAGIRDGDFVKFPGWDLPGEDQAYYPDLKGKVSDLKRILLEKQGHLFLAFNTNGSFKSLAVLDFSKFQKSDSDLYFRVEYPGYYFVQGKNSPGNDLTKIKDVNTATGLQETVLELYAGGDKVAAFDTDGYVKSKVAYPLTDGLENPSSLAGIYIRTTFLNWNFYSRKDSDGSNINKIPESANDIPKLIQEANGISNSEAFNTDGWYKYSVQGPPPRDAPTTFKEPYQGIYYRTCWPDFIYLPGLDSSGNNIRNVGDKQVRELLDDVRKDPQAVAVNTDGWLKSAVSTGDPIDSPGADDLKGIYVQYVDPAQWSAAADGEIMVSADTLFRAAIFALKGTIIIWCRWIFSDTQVREMYRQSVAAGCAEIIEDVNLGRITPMQGAERAHMMRNNFLMGMRDKTSPPGLLVARSIKPAGGQYEYYLNKNALKKFGCEFADLTPLQAREVAVETIKSAGRANPNVTLVIKSVGFVCQGVMAICAVVSVYSVATAPSWEVELGKQVLSWSASIVAGQLGVGRGKILGPVGAILGGIAGNLLGGLGAELLSDWFFGGSDATAAELLLGSALEPASKLVEGKISKAGRGYYTHIVRAKHSAAYASGQHAAVQKMVEEIPESSNLQSATCEEGDDEVLATIVWIRVGVEMLPTNGRNPKDLITLINYIKVNQPSL